MKNDVMTAELEDFTLPEENTVATKEEAYSQGERQRLSSTVNTLNTLATQGNYDLLRLVLNHNAEELLDFLNETGKPAFASFLGRFVETDKEDKRVLATSAGRGM